jgi:hypothetical protein
LRGGARPVG